MTPIPTEPDLHVFAEGACHHDPKASVIAYLIIDHRSEEKGANVKNICVTRIIAARYLAIFKSLQACRNLTDGRVVCYARDEVVVKQLKGEYEVKDEELCKWWALISGEISHFESVEFRAVKKSHPTMRRVLEMIAKSSDVVEIMP